MADINKLVDQLSELTVMEAADLAKALEEKWGVSAAAPVAAAELHLPLLAHRHGGGQHHGLEPVEPFPFSSGYLQRAKHLVPKSDGKLPWRLNQDYLEDCRDFRNDYQRERWQARKEAVA